MLVNTKPRLQSCNLQLCRAVIYNRKNFPAPRQVPSLAEVVDGRGEEDGVSGLQDNDGQVEVDEGGGGVGEEAAPHPKVRAENLGKTN